MASPLRNLVWLVDKLRTHGRLTKSQIKDMWEDNSNPLYDGRKLADKTFYNHITKIGDTFGIDIVCTKSHPYEYYIENSEKIEEGSITSWLISSYATLNQLQADMTLEGRIQFEAIPSGDIWLTQIMDAMRGGFVLELTYRSFHKEEPSSFEVEPYHLKVCNRRWYLIGRNPSYSEANRLKNRLDNGNRDEDVYFVYCLDRVENIRQTKKQFTYHKEFDIEKYFEGCVGVTPDNTPIEHVVLKAYNGTPNYLRTLPIHKSQVEIETTDAYSIFAYDVKLGIEFMQEITRHGDQVEILEPRKLRDHLRELGHALLAYYDNTEESK